MAHLSVPFTNVQQEKTFWCWAAVAANVYNSMRPQSPKSQCDVATKVEGQGACDGPDGSIDSLSLALFTLGINDELSASPRLPLIVSEFQGVSDQFDPSTNENGIAEPVCAEIEFPGNAFHYVAIAEVDTISGHVWVADPSHGGNFVEFSYNDFINNYNYSTAPEPGPGVVQNLQRVVNIFKVNTNLGGPDATHHGQTDSAG